MYYVYIMSNKRGTVLYCGVTNDLARRVSEHVNGNVKSFTKLNRVSRLLCTEAFSDISSAIAREKQIKGWRRAKKIQLIKAINPRCRDLAGELFLNHRSRSWPGGCPSAGRLRRGDRSTERTCSDVTKRECAGECRLTRSRRRRPRPVRLRLLSQP